MVTARLKASLQNCTKEAECIMDGPRKLTEADNHSAVDVGDLRRGTISILVKKPKFSEIFPLDDGDWHAFCQGCRS